MGQALIGDYANYGMSRQNYRTAKSNLQRWGLVTLQITTKGTIATLSNTIVYDINLDEDNQQPNQQVTNNLTSNQPTGNQRVTTNKERKKERSKDIVEIVDYLNQKTSSSFKPSSMETGRLIQARLRQGFTVEDFKKVIDKKAEQWFTDEKMMQYLRPQTLFGPKFEAYLNEHIKISQKDKVYVQPKLQVQT